MNKTSKLLLFVLPAIIIAFIIYEIFIDFDKKYLVYLLLSPIIAIQLFNSISFLRLNRTKSEEAADREVSLKRNLIGFAIAVPIMTLISFLLKYPHWYLTIIVSVFLIVFDLFDFFKVPIRYGRTQSEIDEEDDEVTKEFIESVKIGLKKERQAKRNIN